MADDPPPRSKPVPIVPVPDDAPECAWRHPTHGFPVASWPYHDADGRLVAYAARVEFVGEDGKREKDVLPITCCRIGDERCAWRARALPAPRPLYRVPELIADYCAPVVVTEGEKKADAVPALFPGHVGTTSMGGAGAAKLSDWTPLAGRSVIIWPDHDEPHRRYAYDVAALATAAGAASVAIVACRPNGRKDGISPTRSPRAQRQTRSPGRCNRRSHGPQRPRRMSRPAKSTPRRRLRDSRGCR